MAKPKSKVFRCFDNGLFLMEGTAMEIGKALDMPQLDTIYIYSRSGSKYHKRYTFVPTGKVKRNLFKKDMAVEAPKPRTKHETDLEWIRISLKHYGNTSYHTSGEEFRDELAEEGIFFESRKSTIIKGSYYLERIC